MRRFYVLCLVFISIYAVSQTLEVPKNKKALLFKATASWCIPCGVYHYVTDDIYNNHSQNILFLNGHVATSEVGDAYSGPMHNLLNGGGGIPSFNFNGVKLTDWPPTVEMILTAADTYFALDTSVNVAFQYEINGNELTVNTTTKFFQDVSADKFYVGAMVVENNILVHQETDDGIVEVIQDRVERTVLGTLNNLGDDKRLWADEIANGTVASGSVFNHSLTTTLNSAWNYDSLQVIVVIWQRTGDSFIALSAEDVQGSLQTNIVSTDISSSAYIYPNPAKDVINIKMNNLEHYKVTITDQLGRELYSAISNDDNVTIDVSGFNKGYYFVKLSDDKNVITKCIVVN